MSDEMNVKSFDDFKPLLEAPVLFGLRAQGHVPTIDRLLCDGKSWEEIGKAIGWEPKTAQRHYLLLKGNKVIDLLADALKSLEEIDGIVRESNGVVGWHLNGDVMEWDESEACSGLGDLLARARKLGVT